MSDTTALVTAHVSGALHVMVEKLENAVVMMDMVEPNALSLWIFVQIDVLDMEDVSMEPANAYEDTPETTAVLFSIRTDLC